MRSPTACATSPSSRPRATGWPSVPRSRAEGRAPGISCRVTASGWHAGPMFDVTAEHYDLAYAHKDYAAEAAWVVDAVRARAPHARSLLDVACGPGGHLEHLRDTFA